MPSCRAAVDTCGAAQLSEQPDPTADTDGRDEIPPGHPDTLKTTQPQVNKIRTNVLCRYDAPATAKGYTDRARDRGWL